MSDSQLLSNISYHAWNKDRTQIAICPNNNEVWIYNANGDDPSKWTRKHVLDEHGGQVSGIDWSPTTNLIVTCGHDRNAYVWRFDDKSSSWKPTLVILRINRAATSVKWSPEGNKFAVASGAKCVPVCHFEESNDWWISKMIKKHKSTVLSLAWCPNNKFIITGCADMKARIFSAYMEGIDSSEDDGFGSVFPEQHEFGEVLAEFDNTHSWVHAVAWSPGGFRLAFAGHSSIIGFVQLLSGSQPVIQALYCKDLPYLDIAFTSDNTLLAAGFEGNIDIYTVTSGSEAAPVWSFKDKIDKKSAAGAGAGAGKVGGGISSARNMFTHAADQGKAFGNVGGGTEVTTRHKNIIANIVLTNGGKKLSTAGLDGRIITWDLSSLGLK